MSKPTVTEPARSEGIANAITHGIGALISVLGLVAILILTDCSFGVVAGIILLVLYRKIRRLELLQIRKP